MTNRKNRPQIDMSDCATRSYEAILLTLIKVLPGLPTNVPN